MANMVRPAITSIGCGPVVQGNTFDMPHLNKPLSECADDAVSLLPSAVSSACTIGRIGAAAAALCAVTGFTGWVLGFELLKSLFIPGGITMKANTALGLLSAAASLWVVSTESILASHRRNIAWTLAAFTLLIGAVTLCEHAFGWDLGIDQLLFSEPPGAAATASPGRMGVPASSSFLLLGLALLSICRQTPRSDRISQYLALIVAVIAFLPLIGFAYGIEPLYGIARFTGIAPHTAVAIELLAIGILCARPRGDIMRVICADDTGGMMARRSWGSSAPSARKRAPSTTPSAGP
jgi:hypothetical protein